MSIDVYFYAFNEKRADPSWFGLGSEGFDAGSSDAAEQLDEYVSGSGKVYRPAILNALALLDLAFGSETARVTIDEPRRMEHTLDFLLRAFVPERFSGFSPEWFQSIPTGDIVLLFERLGVDKVRSAVDLMPDEWVARYGVGSRDFLGAFAERTVEFAFQLRPVAAACKRTGARVVMAVNDEPDDTRLMERAAAHLDVLVAAHPGLDTRLADVG